MKRPQKLAVMLVPTPPYEICGLDPSGFLGFVDEFPEHLRIAYGFVFGDGEAASVEKVPECVLVEHAVYHDPLLNDLKVDPVVICPISEQFAPLPLDNFPKSVAVQILQVYRLDLELGEEL